jgi:hypothetical protein
VDVLPIALAALRPRNWDVIRNHWLNHIPPFGEPGTTPAQAVRDVPGLSDVANKLKTERAAFGAEIQRAIRAETIRLGNAGEEAIRIALLDECWRKKSQELLKTVRAQSEIVADLREAIFGEAVYLTHKAAHVLGAAEMSVQSGLRTWALSDSYQSALFSAKAVMSFCGIALAEVNNQQILIDLFPNGTEKGVTDLEAAFWSVGTRRLDHISVWKTMQRVLVIAKCPVWPASAVSKLRVVDAKDFGKQRNELQYDNCGWLLNDLHQFLTDGPFGQIRFWGVSNKDVDFDRSDISLVIGHYLLRLVLLLLIDIERNTGKIRREMTALRSSLEAVRHPLYAGALVE